MKDYDLKDSVTFYFIIANTGSTKDIRGWTDDKCIANFYMKFHNCKNYTLKRLKKTYKQIVPIINENINNEITIMNIITRDKKNKTKIIQIPMTNDEWVILNDTSNTFCSNMVDYSTIQKYLPLLKNRYQQALSNLCINDVISHEIYNVINDFSRNVHVDLLRLLCKLMPEEFD